MSRIDDLFNYWRESMSNSEIAAALTNGDLDKPEWLCISEDTDHLKVWDCEDGSSKMGFYTVPYNDK